MFDFRKVAVTRYDRTVCLEDGKTDVTLVFKHAQNALDAANFIQDELGTFNSLKCNQADRVIGMALAFDGEEVVEAK